MQGPDPDEIKQALMAELGRCRQDELPLSNVAKRPTFQPRGSGTNHIPQARKEQLESKWGIKIVDEESQQMEGLEVLNSRPWARYTNQFMTRHAIESAPPKLAMATHQRPRAIPKAPSSIKSSKAVNNVLVQASPPVSKQKASQNGLQISSGPKGQNQGMDNPAKKANKPKPTPSTTQQVIEQILSQGECELINELDNSSVATKFVAKVHVQRNEGLLMLMPSGKPQSVYNVLNLGVPTIQGPFCIIYDARNERLHKVKLRTSAAAESFQYLLKTLQQSARQFGQPKPASPKPTPTIVAAKEQAVHPLQIPKSAPVVAVLEDQTNTPLQAPSKTALIAPESLPESPSKTSTNGDAITAQHSVLPAKAPLQQEGQESLLNLEDEPQQQPSLTIEAAADHMQHIVQQILSEITASGVNVPEKGVEEIESTAIAHWVSQGFMASETESDELKDELVELLRLLVRIKRKVQYRHGISAASNSASISSATLQDLQEISEKPSKRIKYTTADIKELETQAVSRQDKIQASGLREIQKRPSTPVEPKKISSPTPNEPKKKIASTELSNSTPVAQTEQLDSAPEVSSKPSNSAPKVPGGLATSRWATSGGWSAPTVTAEAARKSPQSLLKATAQVFISQKPSPKGLGSSRWADKEVENKGAFAGF
ncbi:hypothetical protein V8C35DRAFT_281089 [Trichoderma chlorosporum]